VISFLFRRLAQAVIVILGVTLIAFILQNLIATGPALARAIIGPRATNSQITSFIDQYGLNHSILDQYVSYLGQLLRGNLGYSYKLNEPVDTIIAHELPKDTFLVGVALILSLLVAVPLGIWQAVRRGPYGRPRRHGRLVRLLLDAVVLAGAAADLRVRRLLADAAG